MSAIETSTAEITGLLQPLMFKESAHSTFEELLKELEKYKLDICGHTLTPIFLEFSNCFIFSVICLFIIVGVVKFCRYHFSEIPINKLSLRPLIWALLNLAIASTRQILLEFGIFEYETGYFEVIDRLTKLSAMILGMSINYEKQILNMFIIFQSSYKLDELSVAKEDYRRIEEKQMTIYNVSLVIIGIFALLMTVLLLCPFSYFYTNWVRGFIDLIILMFNAIVLRSSLSHNATFFHKLYRNYRYEFHRHIWREATKQALLLLSFIFIDLEGLSILFSDCLFIGCSSWYKQFTWEAIEGQKHQDVCQWYIETNLCFNAWIQIGVSFFGILPSLIYIGLVQPHDCFDCLSKVPEMRITNYQLTKSEQLRRKYQNRYGGCFSCFPTFSKNLKSTRAVERFERKANLMDLRNESRNLSSNLTGAEFKRDYFKSSGSETGRRLTVAPSGQNYAINQGRSQTVDQRDGSFQSQSRTLSYDTSRASSDCNNSKSILYCSNSQLLIDDENQEIINELDIRHEANADDVSVSNSSSSADSY